ncbi:hypothetical protein PtrSN001A_006125 [Pyrenophora tritici-repentis]|nr:hypothetical protein PtrSN001A_006125 [Pyrenophora tritici-repentis]
MIKAVIVTLVLLVAMTAGLDCSNPSNVILPDCTKGCIAGGTVGDVCADDFNSFCEHQGYVNLFSKGYGSCLISDCVSDQEIYTTLITMHGKCTHLEEWPLKVDGNLNDWFTYVFGDSSTSPAMQTATETTGGNVAISFEPSTDQPTPTTEPSSTDAGTSAKPSSNAANTSTSAANSSPPQQSSQSGDGPPAAIPANPTETTVSTDQGQPTTAPASASNNDQPGQSSGQANTDTAHAHAQPTTTFGPNNSTTGPADPPAFGTATIAGTAAGGTVGLALIAGLIYFLMRRRERKVFKPSPANMWDPTHNTDRKPTLPVLQDDTNYNRYSEATQPQMNKAELYSNALLPPPQQTPIHNAFKTPDPGYPHDGGAAGANRYYQPPPQNQHHGNFDTRFPELPAHPTHQPMSSPTSPVSSLSTPHIWTAANTPTFRLSNPDARSDGVRSPVSELGANEVLQSTRSAELSGEEIRAGW